MSTILWLARDFRFTDNAALRAAAKLGPVLPVFLIDQSLAQIGAAPRWRLEKALLAFDRAWHHRTGQHITVLRGEASQVLPKLALELGAARIFQNDWPWQPLVQAQHALAKALVGTQVRFDLFMGHLLINPSRLIEGRDRGYRVYTPFARKLREIGPDRPEPAVEDFTALPSLSRLETHLPLAPDMRRGAGVLDTHALAAGEVEALTKLEDFLANPNRYAEGRDFPSLNVCSALSDHLAVGEISPRYIWQRTQRTIRDEPALAQDLAKFLSEVAWREFAWHLYLEFPQLDRLAWKEDWREFSWRSDNPEAEKWRRAQTGVSLVDAGLREMQVTGRMHNRVRMVVASWLTKHLLTDWRVGLAHFSDQLTDWDPASNAMNWQWVAGCGPDASPFFRIFNPLKQAETFDAAQTYRRYWQGAGLDAWRQAVPPAWASAPPPIEMTELALKPGRERALAALSALKSVPPEA